MFAQTGKPAETQFGSWDDEDMNGYQLLNEVGSGGTLSSLFTILSLFTEDVKMSWQDDQREFDFDPSASHDILPAPALTRIRRANSDVSHFDLESKPSRRSSISSTASTVHARESKSPRSSNTNGRTAAGLDEITASPLSSPPITPKQVPPVEKHRGVVARALEDTTLAVIPAEAFRRLTKKFPKATGHIVQG